MKDSERHRDKWSERHERHRDKWRKDMKGMKDRETQRQVE